MENIYIRSMLQADKDIWIQMLLDYDSCLIDRIELSWDKFLKNRIYWDIAEVDGTISGFRSYVYHETSFSSGEILYLSDLYVRPQFRRMGVAKELVKDLLVNAKAAGTERVYWVTELDNPARKLYDQFGEDDFIRYHVDL